MLGANVEYYQIDNLKLTTVAWVEWSDGKTHGEVRVTKPCSARPASEASLSGSERRGSGS